MFVVFWVFRFPGGVAGAWEAKLGQQSCSLTELAPGPGWSDSGKRKDVLTFSCYRASRGQGPAPLGSNLIDQTGPPGVRENVLDFPGVKFDIKAFSLEGLGRQRRRWKTAKQ